MKLRLIRVEVTLPRWWGFQKTALFSWRDWVNRWKASSRTNVMDKLVKRSFVRIHKHGTTCARKETVFHIINWATFYAVDCTILYSSINWTLIAHGQSCTSWSRQCNVFYQWHPQPIISLEKRVDCEIEAQQFIHVL